MRKSSNLRESEIKVLKCIRKNQPISRAKIASLTGLSKPVVSEAVERLLEQGIVKEFRKGESTAKGGKKPTLIMFNPNYKYVVGVDVGGSKMRAVITDLDGNVVRKVNRKVEKVNSSEDLVEQISSALIDVEIQKYNLLGVAVGIPGTCDSQTNKVRYIPALDLKDVPLKEMLERRLGLPVFVENDVTLNALGEMWKGSAKSLKNVLLVSLGTGTGAGIVLNRSLYTGSKGMAGEIGYFVTDWSTEKSVEYRFGRLERWFSGYSFAEFLKGKNVQTDLKKVFEDLNSYRDFAEFFEHACEHLAVAIANAVCLLDPDAVILSGGIGYNQYEKIMDRIIPIISKLVPSEILEHVQFKKSELGEFGVVIGAVYLVQQKLFVV